MATVPHKLLEVAKVLRLSDQRDELKTRMVRASDALQCCRSVETRTYTKTTGIINGILSLAMDADSGSAIYMASAAPALVTQAGPEITVFRGAAKNIVQFPGTRVGASRLILGRLGSAVPGGVILLSGAQLAKVYAKFWVTELSGALGLALSLALDHERETGQTDCYECLKQRVLAQDKARRYETARIRRRVG